MTNATIETNKLEIRLYESWRSKKLECDFRNDYDIKIIVSGAEKLQDVNVIEYKKDGKKVASIKISFNTRMVQGVTFLHSLKIIGGYAYKKYIDEIEIEINKFILDNLTLDCYYRADLIKRGKGVYIIGTDWYSQGNNLKQLIINENVELSPAFKIFKDRRETLVYEHNNVLFEQGHISELPEFFRSRMFSDSNTLLMILNNDKVYFGIGEKI